MLKTYRQLLSLLDSSERRHLALLLFMVLLMGLLNTAGVASLLPFLAILSNPEILQQNATLQSINVMLGVIEPNNFLIILGIATLVLVTFGQLFNALTVYVLMRYSMQREFSFGTRLLARYLNQPYDWFLTRHGAELGKSLLSEIQRVVDGLLIPAVRVIAQGVVVALLIILLLVVQPVAAVTMAILVGGSYWLVVKTARKYLSRIGADHVRADAERYRATQDALRGFKEIKLFGLEDEYVARFAGPAERFARNRAASNAINDLPRFLLEAVIFGAMMLLLLILIAFGKKQLDALIPIIGVFAFAGARLFPAIQSFYRDLSRLRFNQPTLAALYADLYGAITEPVEIRTKRDTGKLALMKRVELRDAEYKYPGATRNAVNGLNISIDAFSTVGFVGTTGAGKTTAVDVILGLLELHKGALIVDGQDIGPSNRRMWQRSLGYVPQQTFLTDDTVAGNIALGIRPNQIDMAAVERAARLAELHNFVVSELPHGYDTLIGDSGARLSGGERQRICIARALYRDPEMLILDEATSALDNLTERAVMDAVQNLSHRKTILIIAHRLSTVRLCDKIFLFEHGSCIASGSYDELLNNNTQFRDMDSTYR